MTARRLVLAWCWGSVCGLAVGWVYGSAVRDLAAFRALRRAEPGPGAPQLPSGHSETLEDGNGPQAGAQWLDQDELHARPGYQEAIRRAEGRPWEPGVDLVAYMADRGIPSQRDDEPCPVTLGPLTCPFRGPHTNHAFQSGTWAPDAKDDADERIE